MLGKEKIDYAEFESFILPRTSKTLATQAQCRDHLVDEPSFLLQQKATALFFLKELEYLRTLKREQDAWIGRYTTHATHATHATYATYSNGLYTIKNTYPGKLIFKDLARFMHSNGYLFDITDW